MIEIEEAPKISPFVDNIDPSDLIEPETKISDPNSPILDTEIVSLEVKEPARVRLDVHATSPKISTRFMKTPEPPETDIDEPMVAEVKTDNDSWPTIGPKTDTLEHVPEPLVTNPPRETIEEPTDRDEDMYVEPLMKPSDPMEHVPQVTLLPLIVAFPPRDKDCVILTDPKEITSLPIADSLLTLNESFTITAPKTDNEPFTTDRPVDSDPERTVSVPTLIDPLIAQLDPKKLDPFI
jgi:hypothetical protein